jgi:hypothetical protein
VLKIRPYIRNINSSEYIEALANGDLCIAVGYNGDLLQARDRAREANKGIDIKYIDAEGGLVLWFDMLAIPKDAPHPDSAYAFINYILTPQVVADITNFKRFANANLASQPFVLAGREGRSRHLSDRRDHAPKAQGADRRFDRPDARHHPRLAEIQDGAITDVESAGPAVKAAPWTDPAARALREPRAPDEVLRRLQGGRRRQPEDLQGRDLLPAGRLRDAARRRCCACWAASRRRPPGASSSTART